MSDYILEMNGITKEFHGAKALSDVNLRVKRGTIHAIVGENGAGKSTLMNILSGIYPFGAYSGDIVYDGEVCQFRRIAESEAKGIVIIHQELALVPNMTIGENVFLGNERGKAYSVDWSTTYSEAERYLKTVGLHESPKTLLKDVGVGKQQLVEIAKALAKNARLLILDEPTSSLNEEDSRALLDMLLRFKSEGMTCIIISHKLNEIAYVSDEITVIRDGTTVETLDNAGHDIDESRIIRGMVGREIEDRYPKRQGVTFGDVRMEVKNWTVHHPTYTDRKVVDGVSLKVRSGEVVGIYGLMGAGRTELAMSLFGRSYGTGIKGELYLDGERVTLKNERAAIRAGLAYVTENRGGNGLILTSSVRVNTTLANMDGVSRGFIIDGEREYEVAEEYRRKLRTKCRSVEQNVGNLSGGNRQKVLLAKWMFTSPSVLMLDEPTRGIDVGAKYEIYCIINDLVAQGKSVVLISSELPEVLGMSDRIYVMNEGRFVGEFHREEATQEKIMETILSFKGGNDSI